MTLGTRRDRFGLPVAQVDWRPTAADRASIRASQKAVDTALRAAGLGHVEFMLGDEQPPALLEGNFHHLGATRMHADPAMGVVDADCRVHSVEQPLCRGQLGVSDIWMLQPDAHGSGAGAAVGRPPEEAAGRLIGSKLRLALGAHRRPVWLAARSAFWACAPDPPSQAPEPPVAPSTREPASPAASCLSGGGVAIGVGDDAQSVVNAHAAGTTYIVKAGTHLRNFSVQPKSGDRFCGEPGAVLDGGRSLASAFSGGATQRDPGLDHGAGLQPWPAGRGHPAAAARQRLGGAQRVGPAQRLGRPAGRRWHEDPRRPLQRQRPAGDRRQRRHRDPAGRAGRRSGDPRRAGAGPQPHPARQPASSRPAA